VGTLFRTAYALGFEGIYLIKPHVDPFNDKAMRAAKGANLFLPFQSVELESFLELSKGYRLLLASADGQPLVKNEGPTILVLGHETRGISAALMERGERVAIPMRKEAESLNVASAGAILMDRIMHG
jgi:TrmH family RNA methyltransferase